MSEVPLYGTVIPRGRLVVDRSKRIQTQIPEPYKGTSLIRKPLPP
jgi:hypothetical protein